MKRWEYLGFILISLSTCIGYTHAQTLALVHDRTNNTQVLAEVSATGALTVMGTGITACCSVSGALAARSNDTVFFIGGTTGTAAQTLYLLDSSTGNSVQAGLGFPTTLRVLALGWDNTNDRLLALTRSTNAAITSIQLNSVNTSNAALTPIGAGINDCCGVAVGVNALDADNQLWFVVAQPVGSTQWQIFNIDLSTGDLATPAATLSQPPVSLNLDVDLLAIYYDATLPGERLASLDVTTGVYTDIGSGLNDCCFAAQGVAGQLDEAILSVARVDASSAFAFFSTDITTGAFTQQPDISADNAITALLADVGGPQIVEGSSTTVIIDEDNTPTSFALTLNALDTLGAGLNWSVSTPAGLGTASVTTATGLSQVINYSANANANGNDSFVVQVADGNTDTDSIVVNVVINSINDIPSFIIGANQQVNEDGGAQVVTNWANAISTGPANESGQTLQFLISNDNAGLFSVAPSVASNGTLSYTPAANAFGSATLMVQIMDDGGTVSGGLDTSAVQAATITILPVNDVPSFVVGPDQNILEEAGPQNVPGWATAISPGPVNEAGQLLNFVVSNNNNGFFSQQPAVDAVTGALTYTPAINVAGTAIVSVQLMDNGGVANGGVNISAVQQFNINIQEVNDAPSFTPGPNQNVLEDAGAQAVAWATAIDPGAASESGQTLTFIVSNNNNALFIVQPTIDAGGMLSFTTAVDAVGTALVDVQLMDDGGTANAGEDTSAVLQFNIDVVEVNDAPSFTAGPNQNLIRDLGPQTVVGWATDISSGPSSEAAQQLSFVVGNDNNAFFSEQPSVDANGTLTYTPAPDVNGIAMVDVALMDDGGTGNGGIDTSAVQQFMIDIAAVNDPPSFMVGPNVTAVDEDPEQVISPWATNINTGPPDEAAQLLTFNIIDNSDPSLFQVAPAVAADGTLSFTPMLGAVGDSVITLELMDDGGTVNGGIDTSPAQSFSITITPAMADLSLSISSSNVPTTINPFSEFDVTLEVANSGPQGADDLLTEVIITRLNFVSAQAGCANAVDQLVTWRIPSLANGQMISCTFRVQVAGVGLLSMTGTTTSNQIDPIPDDNTDITLLEVLESVPLQVPALSFWSLILLSLLLMSFSLFCLSDYKRISQTD